MAATVEERADLVELLKRVGKLLKWIVFGEHKLLTAELIEKFKAAWPRIEAEINKADAGVKDAPSQALEDAGLTGLQLILKKTSFDYFWKKAKIPDKETGSDSGVDHGSVVTLLEIAQSLLGSIKSALPWLEVVKEFVELVQATMRHLRRKPEILTLDILKGVAALFRRSKKEAPA